VKLMPPFPPVSGGELAVTQSHVVVGLRHGILSGCVMCGNSTSTYWPHEGRFHPLHVNCVPHLFEHWLEILEVGAVVEPARVSPVSSGRGAYGRREARLGGGVVVSPRVGSDLAPVIPVVVQGNPWWRPGCGPDEPWVVVIESNGGRRVFPAGSRVDALRVCSYWSVALGSLIALGGVVVGPDMVLEGGWGCSVDLGSSGYFSSLSLVREWVRCRGCERWRWPGCYVEQVSGCCVDCDSTVAPLVRVWPDEPLSPGGLVEPPVALVRVRVSTKKKGGSRVLHESDSEVEPQLYLD
jgi:hypothetical protein